MVLVILHKTCLSLRAWILDFIFEIDHCISIWLYKYYIWTLYTGTLHRLILLKLHQELCRIVTVESSKYKSLKNKKIKGQSLSGAYVHLPKSEWNTSCPSSPVLQNCLRCVAACAVERGCTTHPSTFSLSSSLSLHTTIPAGVDCSTIVSHHHHHHHRTCRTRSLHNRVPFIHFSTAGHPPLQF